MQMFDKVRLKIITKSLYIKYYEDMGKYPDPAVQHVDFDDHNYPKAENFVTKLNGMINKTIHNIMVEKMAYPSVLYSGDGEFKYLKILMKKEKCSIIKTEHSIKNEFDIRFKINKTLQYILGFTKYPHVEYGEFKVTETEIIGTHDVDLNRAPPASLWVFSDIVKQSYVNNVTQPLLRCIAIDKVSQLVSYESSSYLQYVPISQNYISKIKIWISDSFMGTPLYTQSRIFVRLDILQLE